VAADVMDSPHRAVLIADVVLCRDGRSRPDEWVSHALRTWPGSMVAATWVDNLGVVAGVRHEDRPVAFRADAPRGQTVRALLPCALAAYGWVMAGNQLASLAWIVVRAKDGSLPSDIIRLWRADILEPSERPAQVVPGCG
jgi:hypothetical protein